MKSTAILASKIIVSLLFMFLCLPPMLGFGWRACLKMNLIYSHYMAEIDRMSIKFLLP